MFCLGSIGEFLFHVVEALDVVKIPLCDILNFDQSNVSLVAPHPKTLTPARVKQVSNYSFLFRASTDACLAKQKKTAWKGGGIRGAM